MIEKLWKNQWVVFTKLFISHLLSVLEYLTWFYITAKTQHAYQMIQYTNNLILFFINIDENMRNWRKNKGNLRDIPTKLLVS